MKLSDKAKAAGVQALRSGAEYPFLGTRTQFSCNALRLATFQYKFQQGSPEWLSTDKLVAAYERELRLADISTDGLWLDMGDNYDDWTHPTISRKDFMLKIADKWEAELNQKSRT